MIRSAQHTCTTHLCHVCIHEWLLSTFGTGWHPQGLCWWMELGSVPTTCSGTGPIGWPSFWHQVIIPGHPVPFSGLL